MLPDASILVVEDEDFSRKNLVHILEKEGYAVTPAASGTEALALLKSMEFDLVISDLKMAGVDGMQVLSESRRLQPLTEVIIITGYATVDSAVQALKAGAYHYIAKPFKIGAVRKIAEEALLKRWLNKENIALKESLQKGDSGPLIIGQSKPFRKVLNTVRQVAPSGANLLIYGESGTGKELIAHLIHHLSDRAQKPFVAFNCGAFNDTLMANELFGHEKGAFTGADKAKSGLIEAAHEGTLFLDEIGDMPATMQIQLLRVIQEHELLPIGSTQPRPVDVRFIAATHRDLKEFVEQGQFRQDLFFRLNVIEIRLPPLSEREGDIPLLANFFLAVKRKAMNKEIKSIHPDAMALLNDYRWPGNVRELENVIERAVALCEADTIGVSDLPANINQMSVEIYRPSSGDVPSLAEVERKYIRWVLERCHGNKTKAAEMMGIDRVSLWRKLKRHEL